MSSEVTYIRTLVVFRERLENTFSKTTIPGCKKPNGVRNICSIFRCLSSYSTLVLLLLTMKLQLRNLRIFTEEAQSKYRNPAASCASVGPLLPPDNPLSNFAF